jgi:hypothetical protein
MTRALRAAGGAAALLLTVAVAIAGCGPGNNSAVAPVTTNTAQTSSVTFATIAGAPTALTTTAQAVTLPTVAGVSSVGGNITISTSGGSAATNAVVTVASATTVGSAGGPPLLLQSSGRRDAKAFSGTTITPQYYVGVTNTGTGPTQVNIPTLNLNVNVGSGQSAGLAHYDPTQPQNGWNQHCAFGSGQVNTNGNTTTFSPGGGGSATFTIYPGATLWFAPYTYPSSSTATPSPAPQASGVVPTPAPPPASLTGTYVGSAMQTSPTSQGSQYLQFAVTQSGSSISGTYAVLPSGPNSQGSFGSLSGAVSGGTVTLTATAQFGGSCTTTLNATASGMMLAGTFASQNTQNCSGAGNFSAVLQSSSLPSITGNFSGSISDSGNGSGTLTLGVTTPGTVFSGNGNVTFPSNPNAGGSGVIVGFVTSATTGEFAVINGTSGGTGGGNQGSCQPFGTLTISNNGATLVGNYSNSGSGTNGCSGTGSFTIRR